MDRKTATRIPAIDQHARFIETARALECDEDEAAFDEKLKAVVGPKPETRRRPAPGYICAAHQ